MDKPLQNLKFMEAYIEFRSEIEKYLDCDFRTLFVRHQDIPLEKKQLLIALRLSDYFLKPRTKETKKRLLELGVLV